MTPAFQHRVTAGGFTLFEMLVVLVITGLMGAVLMQGFGIILATRMSVSNTISNLQQVVLSQNIIVDPLRGVLPDYENNPNQFRGRSRNLSGQTLRPLLSRSGAPTPFKMTLDYDPSSGDTTLVYEEPGRPKSELARWAGINAEFKYRDITGVWASNWPPPAGTPQTPWLIWIDIGPSLAPLIASVDGPHTRVTRAEDLPFMNLRPRGAN